MRPFAILRATSSADALAFASEGGSDRPDGHGAQYLAGGTNLLDLMKLDVMRPGKLVDINGLRRAHGAIHAGANGLRLGALARMQEVADHPVIRNDYRVLSDSLWMADRPQLRNMESLAEKKAQRN